MRQGGREDHERLIDEYTSALNHTMKEKSAKNGHKIPLSEERGEALKQGREREFQEIELELVWVKRFGKDSLAFLYELADFNLYAAEDWRRIKNGSF